MNVRLKNLIAGAEAKRLHEEKVAKTVLLTHKCHIVSSSVLAELLGTDVSNAKKLIDKLVAQRILQACRVDPCRMAPRGTVYKLDGFGVLKAHLLQDEFSEFRYDTNARVGGMAQVEHDLNCARIAANWIRHGGKLLETDYTIRRSKTEDQWLKIPDLVLLLNEAIFHFEVERSPKSESEVDRMLLAALQSNWRRTVWVCIAKPTAKQLESALQKREVHEWVLNKSNKWVRGTPIPLPFDFRQRQLVFRLHREPLLDSPTDWIQRFRKHAQLEHEHLSKRLTDEGWRHSVMRPSNWLEGSQECELWQEHRADEKLLLTHTGQGSWRLHLESNHPDEGQSVSTRIKPKQDSIGSPAPAGILEAALDLVQQAWP
ncbi:MAG: hypothetical protein I8H88_04555 [Burkholderiales bacterium]|nr:hypothetical protein [Burkholderiales bacterium]